MTAFDPPGPWSPWSPFPHAPMPGESDLRRTMDTLRFAREQGYEVHDYGHFGR